MLGIEERDSVVAAEVEGFVPCRPKDIVQRAIDAGMTFKTAKGIADIPDTIFPPDRHETIVVAFVETVTVIESQATNRFETFQFTDACQQSRYEIIVAQSLVTEP